MITVLFEGASVTFSRDGEPIAYLADASDEALLAMLRLLRTQ